MDRYKLLSWSAVIVSIALLLLPRIVPICTGLGAGGSPMQCHYAYQAVFVVTLLAVIQAAAFLVLRTAEARLLNGFVLLLLGITIIVLPQSWAIGICPHGGACAKTTFFLTLGGGLLVLLSAATVWLNRQTREELPANSEIRD
ncbi:MAG TPA: DUF4418 domain-containing protein [Firmicutes bacterium]|nr:DUF4418 domain-containing protein [Bacillota bacterium]HWR55945.1 DUF4418 family protein [Negativicutes bacterium]